MFSKVTLQNETHDIQKWYIFYQLNLILVRVLLSDALHPSTRLSHCVIIITKSIICDKHNSGTAYFYLKVRNIIFANYNLTKSHKGFLSLDIQ